MATTNKFKTPGQFRHEDILLAAHLPLENVYRVQKLKLDSTDVVVASYSKTGTTMLQEVVWLIQNNANTEKANMTKNVFRVPYLELNLGDMFKVFEEIPHPRALKTHVPYRYLPITARQGSAKIVCIMRNPKDTLVSYYHFHRMNKRLGPFKGSWDDFFEYFKDNEYLLTYGNPIKHMKDFWDHKEDDNMYIVFYEDLIREPKTEIRKLAEYLHYDLDEAAVDRIVTATSFDVMKTNPNTNMDFGTEAFLDNSVSSFYRKGKIGDWKNYFNDEQNEIMDEMQKEFLENSDLRFTYE